MNSQNYFCCYFQNQQNILLQFYMSLLGPFLFLLLFLPLYPLHLFPTPIHQAVSSTTLQSQLTAALQNLTQLNASLTLALNSLNPYNQQQRITTLENSINSARNQLFYMYVGTEVPLNGSTYYCQQLTPSQMSTISNSISSMLTSIANMGAVPPFSNSLHPFTQTSYQLQTILNTINTLLPQTGTPTAGPPVNVNQNNLAGGFNWALNGATPSSVASSYVVGAYQNGFLCPMSAPYVSSFSSCMNCPGGYYDVNTLSCISCANFSTITQSCYNGPPPVVNPVAPPPPPPVVNPMAPPQPPPVTFITNTTNPVGLLLPPNQTLATFQATIAASGVNVKPCPAATPYFDGTICIACPGQLFNTTIQTCQTCPSSTLYSNSTFQCIPILYYTNITVNKLWISTVQTPLQLYQNMAAAQLKPGAMACPPSTPYFTGSQCIVCPVATPYFSFDTNSCINCGGSTVFSLTSHNCVIAQPHQTALTSPNLVLGGLPYNEWMYYYVNNQTANPQLANCPTATPYFDGLTCIACNPPTPYFSLTHRVCINCQAGTTYSVSVMECLSSAGNIVTQNPTLVKMAAGIFA